MLTCNAVMTEFDAEAFYKKWIEDIKDCTVRKVLSVVPRLSSTERTQTIRVTPQGQRNIAPTQKPAPVRAAKKVGRNDPCPCGSGKKYKKCCGQGEE
jgi:preprotein translocase subunit SecA